jgi:hypothetical protein
MAAAATMVSAAMMVSARTMIKKNPQLTAMMIIKTSLLIQLRGGIIGKKRKRRRDVVDLMFNDSEGLLT